MYELKEVPKTCQGKNSGLEEIYFGSGGHDYSYLRALHHVLVHVFTKKKTFEIFSFRAFYLLWSLNLKNKPEVFYNEKNIPKIQCTKIYLAVTTDK